MNVHYVCFNQPSIDDIDKALWYAGHQLVVDKKGTEWHLFIQPLPIPQESADSHAEEVGI